MRRTLIICLGIGMVAVICLTLLAMRCVHLNGQVAQLQDKVEVQDLYLEQIVRIVAVEGCDSIDRSYKQHNWCGDLIVWNEGDDTRITLTRRADNRGYYMNLHWNNYPIINDANGSQHITGEAHDYSLKHVDE